MRKLSISRIGSVVAALSIVAIGGCGTFDMLNVSGNATIGGTTTIGGATTLGGDATVAGALNASGITSPGAMSLKTGGATRLLIDATNGNVGIGMETPAFKLDVAGAGHFVGTVFADAFSSNSPLLLQTNSTTRIFVSDTTGNVGIGTQTPSQLLHVTGQGLFDGGLNSDFLASRANNTSLDLRTGSTSRLFIDTDGEVAVGHSDPRSKFDVRGSIRTSTVNGNETNGLIIVASGTVADMTYSTTLGNATTTSTKVRFDMNTARFFGDTGFGRAPTTNRLEVAGNASKDAAGDWLANSDARIKTNVKTIENALETLDRVRLISFNYTDVYRAEHPSLADRPYLNVIAQEFREIFPDYVQVSKDTLPDGERILQVDTYPLTIYTAAAVQELHKQLRDRDAEIAELRAKLEALIERVSSLENGN